MDLFDLVVKITADTQGVDDGINTTGKQVDSLASKFKSGLVTAAKGASVAVGAVGTAMTAATKKAVDAYSNYEQLVGGVETLFEDSSDVVLQYANNAYKTAGMSANEYMETVTSFSASLLQSLDNDTAKATETADLAITDMSDNANKMGTDITSIQNAYQGFAKQNYTMLDNLKLGYGGTKEEMERLLEDAEKISGIEYDIDSYADIINAIHTVQTEIGITGTTAAEAGSTIQGSTASIQAAWENLMTGLADPSQDLSTLIDNLVGTAETAMSNLIPRIEQAMEGLASAIDKITPIIIDKLPGLIDAVLPSILNAVTSIVTALVLNLPELVEPLIEAAEGVFETITSALAEKIPALAGLFENLDVIIAGVTAAFVAFKAALAVQSIITGLTSLIGVIQSVGVAQTALNLIMAANPIGLVVAAVAALVAIFVVLWNKSESFREFWVNLWEGIKDISATAVTSIRDFFRGVADFITEDISEAFQKLIDWFGELPEKIAYNLGLAITKVILWGVELADWVKTEVPKIVDNIVTFFAELPSKIWSWLTETITKVSNFITGLADKINTEVPKIVDNFVNFFKSIPEKIVEIGKNIISGLWNGISSAWSGFTEEVNDLFDGFVQGIKDGLGIHSPSKVFANIGGNMAAGLDEGWTGEYLNAERGIDDSIDNTVRNAQTTSDNITSNSSASNITININGIQYQDFNDLTMAIAEQLQFLANREMVGYGA